MADVVRGLVCRAGSRDLPRCSSHVVTTTDDSSADPNDPTDAACGFTVTFATFATFAPAVVG